MHLYVLHALDKPIWTWLVEDAEQVLCFDPSKEDSIRALISDEYVVGDAANSIETVSGLIQLVAHTSLQNGYPKAVTLVAVSSKTNEGQGDDVKKVRTTASFPLP